MSSVLQAEPWHVGNNVILDMMPVCEPKEVISVATLTMLNNYSILK